VKEGERRGRRGLRGGRGRDGSVVESKKILKIDPDPTDTAQGRDYRAAG